MNLNKDFDDDKDDTGDNKLSSAVGAEASMNTLILWNISKALQRNPNLDLKVAINNAHDRLDNTRDVNKIITQSPEERHIACALLAWQELGHSTAESLYRFIEDKLDDHERKEFEKITLNTKINIKSPPDHTKHIQTLKNKQPSNCSECTHSRNKDPEKCTDKAKGMHKVEITNNGVITHPESNYSSSMESKSYLVKHTHQADQTMSNDSTPKIEPIKSDHSKSSNRIFKEVSFYNYDSATQSNYCVLKDTNKADFFTCPFMSAANNPSFECAGIDHPIHCDSSKDFDTGSLKGPVVTLPPETKLVMRFDGNQSPCVRHQAKKPRGPEKNIMSKIDAACCMDSACAERLSELDKATTELRNRAARLARREAQRSELLERAEAAWKDLELGYQRRLTLAEEKEYDMAKQVNDAQRLTKKLIEDRNGYKTACMNLAKVLKERGEATEKKRQDLVKVEKEMCALACVRMRLSEEAARSEALVNEQQIKVAQLDRDLRFKEEQTRRKLLGVQGEVDSVQALTIEAERAMRAELAALRDQIETVSKQLLREDDDNKTIKTELDDIRAEKLGLVEDLEGCQVTCDKRMQKNMDELKKARERLAELKEKVMECKCKIPIDAAVEVKRTPSLAALCTCAPEDKLLESCSCTSLRSQLLSNLLSDLFGGLQIEIGDVAAQMPCQYLKCLEDKHNWDKASLVKSNLRSYFSKLLIGELDIAIATAIENYHARWVGATCVDTMRSIPDTVDANTEGWQERAIERRAQKLANKLAEQLFQERADQLVQRAKDVVKTGPPPCDCKETAVFPCLIKPPTVGSGGFVDNGTAISAYWRKTNKDVSLLRVQIEDLKKESLKKEDLKLIEDKISKLVQRPSEPELPIVTKEINTKENINGNINKPILDTKSHNQQVHRERTSKYHVQVSKPILIKKKNLEVNSFTKRNQKNNSNEEADGLNKNMKKAGLGQAFAVNTCFCGNRNMTSKIIGEDTISHRSNADIEQRIMRKESILKKNMTNQIPSSKQSKPISGVLESTMQKTTNDERNYSCPKDGVCFHKIPSNTSIDKLLEKMTKWRCDLIKTPEEFDIMTKPDIENFQQNGNESKKSSLCIQSNIIYQVSAPKFSDKTNHDVSTNINRDVLANTTESEYMGAINLDKSNYQCKCNIKQQNIHKYKTKDKIQDENSILKCIDSKMCECRKSFEKKEDKLSFENIIDNENLKHNNITGTNINNIVKTSETFSCDCDYYVKLLGVTLANISSHKVFEANQTNRNHTNGTALSRGDPRIMTSSNKAKNDNDVRNIETCQCHVQFDEFKNYMENNFKKPLVNHTTKDKELDIPSLKGNSSNNEEYCICCNNGTINDSLELEVNTFYLLEEHLRGRLEELKKSCCKFNDESLPIDEEEKLFSAILQRVKQIISNNTNDLTCKCQEGNNSDGSWNRANILLQEYLKTKIKKVQCLCGNEEQKQKCILPKVLQEIYSLIDKDFQRLRNLYKYQNTDGGTEGYKGARNEIPEKDTSSDDCEIKQCTHKCEFSINSRPKKVFEKLSKCNSTNSMMFKQNMWVQVPVNLMMNTKSCDAIEKGTKNVQTTESLKNVKEKGYNSVQISNCDCEPMINNYIYGTKGVLVNHHISKLSNNDNHSEKMNLVKNYSSKRDVVKKIEKSSFPYIGYTVDCSCKCALGTCTCIKSTVTRNNEEINNLWHDLTKDNIQSQKYSYIMKSIQENRNIPVNSCPESLTLTTTNKSKVSINIESDFNDEEIILKDSDRNVIVTNNSANTTNDDMYIDESSARNEERDEICDCRLIKPILKNRSESNLTNSMNMHKTQSLSCDCNMVPVCHVKMLVDSIEHRIFHSKCICNPFSARVCPIHSKI